MRLAARRYRHARPREHRRRGCQGCANIDAGVAKDAANTDAGDANDADSTADRIDAPSDKASEPIWIDSATCVSAQSCDMPTASCLNECGQPCQCIDLYGNGSLVWNCLRPLTGTGCDPTLQSSCYYPPADPIADPDGGQQCTCQNPAGEWFWDCGSESICVFEGPVHSGDSCAGYPWGLSCKIDATYECDCVANTANDGAPGAEFNHVWNCVDTSCLGEPGDGASCADHPLGQVCRYASGGPLTDVYTCTAVDGGKVWKLSNEPNDAALE